MNRSLFRLLCAVGALVLLGSAILPRHAVAGLRFEFDYQYDTFGFFNDPARREALEAAGDFLIRYTDSLDAIEPSGTNTWTSFFNPPDRDNSIFLSNLVIPQDAIIVYVAGRPLQGRLAQAIDMGPVGFGTQEWVDTVEYRGQTAAKNTPARDFGPMGGTISFNNNLTEVPWHFDLSTAGLNANEFDFITVAMHELIHLLGFGISRSFDSYVDGQRRFFGPESVAVGSSTNPTLALDEFEAHWKSGTKGIWNGTVQEALLAPGIFPGRRAFPTALDRAALRDIGWEEASPGDANLDRKFDSQDFIAVFQAGKYETGVFAGWGDGDWNDNARFESGDLIEALQTGTYEQPAAVNPESLVPQPNDLLLTYNATTGGLAARTLGDQMTALEIQSASGLFGLDAIAGFDGPFDVVRADKLFRLGVSGFDALDFGDVLPLGLTTEDLANDLTVRGAVLGGGGLRNVSIVVVPEPASVLLALAGLGGLWHCRRTRR